MQREYITPAGEFSRLYMDMLNQHHLLIAGRTGAGKSVVINGIMHAALYNSPARARFILIDPKRVELADYAYLPHTIAHAAGFFPEKWLAALNEAIKIMDSRYAEMERKRQRMYTGADLYIVIDEWAAIYKNGGAACFKAVLRLISEGRAARCHVIMATQVPKASIIPTEIRENFTARLCLRVNTISQSRVLMDQPGCESLPEFGEGYYITPRDTTLYKLPMISDKERQRLIRYWTGKAGKGRLVLFNR